MEGVHELIYQNLYLLNKKKEILKNLNGKIESNSMVAILGPSGAGKSSFLNSLAGRIPSNLTLYSDIYINGYSREEVNWANLIGYVEQDFHAYEQQSVAETFNFIAELKGIGRIEVEMLISQLNLSTCKNTYLSNLSGGQKKRVSIGIELLNNPKILFLDEPLSGLDSFNAMNIIEILSKLKNEKSIIMTVHQPSYKMLQYFDKIILISEGMLVFDGELDEGIRFFNENGFYCPTFSSPSDFFLENISIDTLNEDSKMKSYQNLYKLVRANEIKSYEIVKKDLKFSSNQTNTSKNLVPLIKRNAINFLRDKRYIFTQLGQKIVFLILLGSMFFNLDNSLHAIQSISGLIIFLINNSMFGTCAPIFSTFGMEKKIIQRERRSGLYNGFHAYVSKFVIEYSFISITTIFYISILYWVVKLENNFWIFLYFLLIQLLISTFACAFALAVSTLTPNQRLAQVFGSMIALVFVMNGGFYSNINTTPKYVRWLIWVSPVNYAYKASMQIIFKNKTFVGQVSRSGKQVLEEFSLESPRNFLCVFIIFLYSLLFMIIGSIALHYKSRLSFNLGKNKKVEKQVQ
ncbi:ABC transporter [Tubulinosema ratisbonensis]|uniref:ABC transporter n=1 Tax=Tubulinosema ratisbonensis TaxID=291195 RepID=A0A437AMV2_9MICR|nr:ABC transporter [Tubulinosema ratisbonensis]